MKHFQKGTEPVDFSNWKVSHPLATYRDLRNESMFGGANQARSSLRASLLREQGGLCCYCETRITSGNFHVEHFRPKSLFPHIQLDYTNLHACCEAIPAGGSDEHCGHKKGDSFSPALVSPLEKDCESHFSYDLAGNISGLDNRGTDSIAMLHLDSALLNRSRKSLIEFFESLTDDDDYNDEIGFHLDNHAYPLGEFFTTIESLHNSGLLH